MPRPPPKPSRQRRLTSRKDRTRYAVRKKQSENEKCHNNVLSGSLFNGTITSEKNEDIRNQSCEGKDKELSSGTGASSPSHTSYEPADDFHGETDLSISPTTGALRRLSSISYDDDVFKEEESHPTLVDGTNKVFTVSSITFIDDPLPRMYLHPSKEKVQLPNASTPSSISDCPFQTVEDLLKSELPTTWEVSTTGKKTSFLLRMKASADNWGAVQRSALISRDGTVQLDVHCQVLCLDHQLWQDLPCRVGLTTNQESVDNFLKYVLEVVNVFRSYVVCMGIHEPRYAELAAKQSGLVFDANPFKESRYTQTFRSHKCEILIPTKTRTRKYCSPCSATRELILRRCKAKDFVQSPHTKESNKLLNSNQKKRKLAKSSQEPEIA